MLTSIHKINNIYAAQKTAPTQNRTHRPPMLPDRTTSITTTTPTHFIISTPFMIYDQLRKDERPLPLPFLGMCLQRVMFVFFTLIIPRFFFLLSTCFMFVLLTSSNPRSLYFSEYEILTALPKHWFTFLFET